MEWKEYKLGEIADFKTGKLNSNAAVLGGQYPFFTCSPETLAIDNFAFDQKAILLAGNNAEGNFGIKYYEGKFNAYQRTYVISALENIDIKFLFYSLKLCLERFKSMSQGSATKFLTAAILRNFAINLPSLSTQRRISSILSSLDRKIELNNKINATLEEMAQALFKSWFVDFEPFKNGNFIDTEIGKIPEGWRVEELGSVCTCLLGGTPSRSVQEYWNGDVNWINSGAVNEFRITKPSEKITELGLQKSATKLLPRKTTVLAITGATLGQVSLLEIDSCANQSVIGVLENDNVPYEFIYPLVNEKIKELISHQTGGAQQHINKDNVSSLSIVLPPKDVITEYRTKISPLYAEIGTLCLENDTLTHLRDTLLPRLMSGEIEV